MYAGVRPARMASFVNLEGFGMAPTHAEQAPKRYARWLESCASRRACVPMRAFPHWPTGCSMATSDCRARGPNSSRATGARKCRKGVTLRGDPAHKIVNPVLYRYEEVRACWEQVRAPVLWVEGAESETPNRLHLDAAQIAERRAAFRESAGM